MTRGRAAVAMAGALFVAAALQASLGFRAAIFGAHPDFLLLAVALIGVVSNRRTGMVAGFAAGLAEGALSGANMQAYVASRTLVGLLLGWAGELEPQLSVPVAFGAAASTALLGQLALMFLAPAAGILGFLADTLRTAAYDGVLAIPAYALLKRIWVPTDR